MKPGTGGAGTASPASRAACISTGQDEVILEANLAAGALLGIAPDLMKGSPFEAYLEPRCVPAFRSTVAAPVQGEGVPVQEYRIARPDGSTLHAAVAVSVAHDPGSGSVEFLRVICDARGEKRAE